MTAPNHDSVNGLSEKIKSADRIGPRFVTREPVSIRRLQLQLST